MKVTIHGSDIEDILNAALVTKNFIEDYAEDDEGFGRWGGAIYETNQDNPDKKRSFQIYKTKQGNISVKRIKFENGAILKYDH